MLITDVITEITDSNFDEFVTINESTTSSVRVVDLWAPWCGPCKVLGPIMDQLAIEYFDEKSNIKIGKMNVDNSRDKAVELGITSVPTVLIYKDGALVERTVGMIAKVKLNEIIRKYI